MGTAFPWMSVPYDSKIKEKSRIEDVCDETSKKILPAISLLCQIVMKRCTTFEAVDESLWHDDLKK